VCRRVLVDECIGIHLTNRLFLHSGNVAKPFPGMTKMEKKICVLYADDDADDIEMFQEILHDIDRSILFLKATDGLEALKLLRESLVPPDVVFLDINMPLINGKECLMEIRRDEHLKEIPVIMYSTANTEQEVVHCLELGASDYLCKASNYDKLRGDIESILRNLKSSRAYTIL